MNTVKEFYVRKFRAQMPDVEHAFRWRLSTMPAGEKLGSFTFLVCYTIAFLGSLCLAGAVYEAYNAFLAHALDATLPFLGNAQALLVAILAAVIWLLGHTIYYRRVLSKRRDTATIKAAEREVAGSDTHALG